MATALKNIVIAAKCGNCSAWGLLKAIWQWMHGFCASKKNAAPSQPIDYVPITKRNGALVVAARTVTGENWD